MRVFLRQWSGRLRFIKRAIVYCRGQYARECPICGFQGRFLPYSWPPRIDAMCPACGSVERHRLLALAMTGDTGLVKAGDDVLHFAPERWVRPMIAGLKPATYRTADIDPKRADMALNIEALDLPDASVDVVIASHVLEHVDDAKAIPEIFRILRPGGRFLCMIPIIEGWDHTFEDASIATMKERKRHFEGKRHLRYFGRDIRDRLAAAGFRVGEHTAFGRDVLRYGLQRGEKVFVATKPSDTTAAA
ncbi:MAG: methyltransferase domain-containing protein [Pseudomonadota bacterium]|nr:methyltransferase domain-containing protein [Pseudomonadota bacterium]